ncbi:hypothetical protein PFISCL1PPCAC_19474, partial [Pristionchus fissidentatus]
KKKKKKKRSKSSDKRRRSREAEKMENILNKHLKRSREKEEKIPKRISSKDSPKASSSMDPIEIVTISDDDEPPRGVKKARIDDSPDVRNGLSRSIPGPATPKEDDDCENHHSGRDENGEMKDEIQDIIVLDSHASAPNISLPSSKISSSPQPVPPPVLPSNVACPPGFTRASFVEAETPSTCSVVHTEDERPPTAEPDYSSGLERNESRDKSESRKKEKKSAKRKKKDSSSLKESLQQEIRMRESGHYSPERRGRSRSYSYSPRRDRSRSRDRSRDWRYGGVKERGWSRERGYDGWRGYDRWRRWSRSPNRSRSCHRSYSRDGEESRRWSRSRSRTRSRERSRTRERSRSESRERSRERSRSATPLSPVHSSNQPQRDSCSPMPRSYARFRNRSSECREKKRREEKEREEMEKSKEMGEDLIVIDDVETPKGVPPAPVSSLVPSLFGPLPPPLFGPVLPPPSSLTISTASSPSVPHSRSSSPSIFVPPPPIVAPIKPQTLKICLLTKKRLGGGISASTSKSATSLASHSSDSNTSLILDQVPLPTEAPPPRNTAVQIVDVSRCIDGIKSAGVSSSSDMSVEGNSGKSNTSIGEKGTIGLNRPTPPLSNPSADENRLDSVSLPPPPRPPLLDTTTPPVENGTTIDMTTGNRVSTPSPTPLAATILKATMCSTNRSMMSGCSRQPLMGPGPSPPPQSMMYPQQYYSSPGHMNPYGPQPAWMNHDPSWHHHNYYYGQGGPMMGGYGNPSGMHHGPMPVPPPSTPQPSLINAMGVMRTPAQQGQPINTIDWGQAAREHAIMTHQHNHPGVVGVPPPPPMNQPHHMMGGPPLYGTPHQGRGGSGRFRGGGGKGRRW